MSHTQAVSATLEDYLEAILKLEREKTAARVRDLAAELKVHKSTVTAALKALAERELVSYSPYELAALTPAGRQIAEEVTRHHGILKRFLTDVLLLDKEAAGANACRMEHVVDGIVMERLVLFARFLKGGTPAGRRWLKQFGEFVAREGGQPHGARDGEGV